MRLSHAVKDLAPDRNQKYAGCVIENRVSDPEDQYKNDPATEAAIIVVHYDSPVKGFDFSCEDDAGDPSTGTDWPVIFQDETH